MDSEETVIETPHEVVEAVKQRARRYRKDYEHLAEEAASYQEMARNTFDQSTACREKAEQCEKWLDERAPDWRGEDDE